MLTYRTLIFTFFIVYMNTYVHASYFTHCIKDNFKTLQVYNNINNLSFPVISLGSNQNIMIEFDELADSEQNLRYEIIHCNSDWGSSELLPSEYISGFKSSFIENYDYSYNTNIPYIHYTLEFPNAQTDFKISGNYAILIFNEENEEVLQACFRVCENKVQITPEITFVTERDIKDKHQQVEFTISHPGLIINDPQTELKVMVQQNSRTDNIKKNIKPTFINSQELRYQKDASLIFDGGNEYRYFEATTTRYTTHGIESIQYHSPYYHMVLSPDEPQSATTYNYHHDVDGQYFIRKQESDEANYDLEADYVYVHFTIPSETPYFSGKVYLNGVFTQGQLTEDYQMKYDFGEKAYYTNVLLKQGRYDYQYLLLPTGTTQASYTPLENNFFETENQYQIFCYFRSFSDKHDRLVGYCITSANAK